MRINQGLAPLSSLILDIATASNHICSITSLLEPKWKNPRALCSGRRSESMGLAGCEGSVVTNPPVKKTQVQYLGRFPGEGHGNPLHCSCLGNPTEEQVEPGGLHSPPGHKELDRTLWLKQVACEDKYQPNYRLWGVFINFLGAHFTLEGNVMNLLIYNYQWSVTDLQCCASFKCTASLSTTHIHSLLKFCSHTGHYRVQSRVLRYTRGPHQLCILTTVVCTFHPNLLISLSFLTIW